MIPVIVKQLKIGEGIPKICVPIVGETFQNIMEEAQKIKSLHADIVEWRADWYEDILVEGCAEKVLEELRQILGETPILFTFRTKGEGGEKWIDDDVYLELNRRMVETGFADLVDVEVFMKKTVASKVINCAHEHHMKVVASNHDFEKTPSKDEIVARLEKMQDMGADILKIAVMPRVEEDVRVLLLATEEMSKQSQQPVVTMSMSEMGVVTRIEGERYGSAITFGAAGKKSAPGQIPVEELRRLLEEFHQSKIKKG